MKLDAVLSDFIKTESRAEAPHYIFTGCAVKWKVLTKMNCWFPVFFAFLAVCFSCKSYVLPDVCVEKNMFALHTVELLEVC